MIASLEKLHHEYESLVAEHLPDLIQGALHRVFRQHPFTAEEIGAEVASLLRDMEQAGRIGLECSPAEAQDLQQRLETAGCQFPTAQSLRFSPMPRWPRASFVLRSDLGDVDGRHSSRIRQIHHALEAPQ